MPRRPQPNGEELRQAAAFRTALRRFLGRADSVAVEAGLTRERYDLLLMIKALAAEGREVRLIDLFEPLQLRQTAVTELVKRAEAAGLLRKEAAADDGRAISLRLTREGDRRLSAAFDALRADREQLLRAFGEANRQLRRIPG